MQNEELEISKTKRKEHAQSLQKLGMDLVSLSANKLSKIELPEVLLEAIRLAQKLTANGAIYRQNQYIGKLMKDVDIQYVSEQLAKISSNSIHNTRILHVCETWRDRLLKDEQELNLFVNQYGQYRVSDLKSLIRVTKKEQEAGKVKNYRKLFKLIRDIIEMEKQ